jgi:hypothetical protein
MILSRRRHAPSDLGLQKRPAHQIDAVYPNARSATGRDRSS